MHRAPLRILLSALAVSAIVSSAAWAKPKPRKPGEAQSQESDTEKPKDADTSDAPDKKEPPAEFAVPASAEAGQGAEQPAEEEQGPKDTFYGAALRARWVSVPSWLLGLFTVKNVPVSSYGYGVELVRRKKELDFVLGFSYTNLTAPDGNWLGKNGDPTIDTDLVQFRNFGLIGVDASFVWHTNFNEFFGLHYGAGLGVAMVSGQILRTSDIGCTPSTVATCRPKVCDSLGCRESDLKATEIPNGDKFDSPDSPHRFSEPSVPPIVPILNMVLGFDLHLPQVKGLEARVEGGFYNAFFVGGALGYLF